MSQESSKVLSRQWKIIQFLINSHSNAYVSSTDIEHHLYQQGIETTQRTIQRDLNLLETLFPLECRRDCMPYNWRWKKIQSTVKGLNLTQALVLRLVSEELKGILPQQTLHELEPLLEKARLLTSDAIMDNQEHSILDILNPPQGRRGVVEPSILGQLISHVSDKVNAVYRDSLNLDAKALQKSIQQVAIILKQHALPELAQALKN